jgi:hypothetical protein
MSLCLGVAMAQDAPKTEKKAAPAAGAVPELKTMTYKGSLVDMSCATAEKCTVKADSSQMGMKLDDGRVLRFDMVGNQRAQEELKTNKRWTKDLTANKPVRATVDGVVQGEKLIVSSIH